MALFVSLRVVPFFFFPIGTSLVVLVWKVSSLIESSDYNSSVCIKLDISVNILLTFDRVFFSCGLLFMSPVILLDIFWVNMSRSLKIFFSFFFFYLLK